jgi:hypothetical protein
MSPDAATPERPASAERRVMVGMVMIVPSMPLLYQHERAAASIL